MGGYQVTWFVVLLPLVGALASFLAETQRRAAQIVVAFSVLGFALAMVDLVLRLTHPQQPPFIALISYFSMSPPETTLFTTRFEPQFGIQVDALSAAFGAAFAFVLAVVQAHALWWLRGDTAFRRFFWASSAFGFAVLGFVYSPNAFQSLVMWLLATFGLYVCTLQWLDRADAAAPGRRMLVVLRTSDVALFLGVVYVLIKYGAYASLQAAPVGQTFFDPFAFGNITQASQAVLHHQVAHGSPKTLAVIAALMIFAAVVRAAQAPFHAWLTRLAATPAPVLALGATGGTALGALLITRTYGTLVLVPHALTALALTGAVGALVAALVALAQRNVLRIVALAGAAQAGLALVALGAGGYSQGLQVLFTGSFVVLLLALAVANVVRAYRSSDIDEIGGAWRRMRGSSLALGVATLGLAGLSLTTYWTLSAVFLNAAPGVSRLGGVSRVVVAALVVLAAIAIAAFAVRLLVRVTRGDMPRRRGFQPERVREAERAPLRWTLLAGLAAIAAVVAGLPGIPAVHSGKLRIPGMTFTHFVFFGAKRASLPVDGFALLLVLVALVLGGAAAIAWASARRREPARTLVPAPVQTVLARELGTDAVEPVAGVPFIRAGAALAMVDVRVLDSAVDTIGDAPGVLTLLVGRTLQRRQQVVVAGGVALVAVAALLSVLAATGHLWVHTA